MRNLPQIALLTLVSAALVSCATRRVPDRTATIAPLAPSAWAAEPAQAAPVEPGWLARFGDPQLLELAREAERQNFGLEAANQRLRAAEAVARIAGSRRYPSLALSLRSGKQKSRLNLPAAPVTIEAESHSLNLGTQWEVDLWSRISRAHASALAQYEASQQEFAGLRLSLAGQVAKSWFDAIEAAQQLELARQSAASFDSKLDALEKRYRRGLTDAFDLRLTRAQAASARAAAASRRSQLDATLRALQTLLGRYPSSELEIAESLPEAGPPPPAGLPAALLARRPDLQAQERRLAAAFADAQAAGRNWLPDVVLSASSGYSAERFADLLDDSFSVWALAGELVQPVFAAGRLHAEREQARALQASQLAEYKDLALRAFREAETALQAEADLAVLEEQSALAADESERAEQQAWNLYERGLIDITGALDAERRSFDATSQLLSVRNRRLQNRIDLHLALGGDYAPGQAQPTSEYSLSE